MSRTRLIRELDSDRWVTIYSITVSLSYTRAVDSNCESEMVVEWWQLEDGEREKEA